MLSLYYLFLQQLLYHFPNYVYRDPPCRLSLWEETGVLGENPGDFRQSIDTLFSHAWVRSENRTHDIRGERHIFSNDCATEAPI